MASRKHRGRIEAALAAGNIQHALELCQARLRLNPRDTAIILLLGRTLLAAGDFPAAQDALEQLTARTKAPAEAYLMHAYALIQIERSEAALERVVAGLRAHPRHVELLQNAGLLADRLTQPVESEGYFRTLTDIAPERGDAWLGLGNALQRQGRDDEALAAYTAAAAADPGNPSPLVNLANLYGKQDDHAGAQAAYREVLRRFPERGDVRANLAASLVRSKDYVAAVAVFEDYLRDEPDDFDVSLSRAKALLKAGDPAASIRALTDMANRFPDQPQTCPELVNAQLTQGNAAAAKSIVENFLDRFPKSADVYSCLPILNAALRPGELDEGKAALDAEIQVYDLAIPPEYTDAEDFFEAVRAAILAHPSLMDSPSEHATRDGQHTGDMAKAPVPPPLAALIRAIKGRVRDYAGREASRANAFLGDLDLDSAEFNLWAVVMREGGHQVSHIHPSARISGVVYGKVPDSIQDGSNRAGWIEFGRPPADFLQPELLPTKIIKPKLGQIVLFPSYMYHATMPLSGAEHRISLAFDVVG